MIIGRRNKNDLAAKASTVHYAGRTLKKFAHDSLLASRMEPLEETDRKNVKDAICETLILRELHGPHNQASAIDPDHLEVVGNLSIMLGDAIQQASEKFKAAKSLDMFNDVDWQSKQRMLAAL